MIIPASKTFDGSDLLGRDGSSIAALQRYLDSLDWGPGSRDRSGYLAFLRAGSLGIDSAVASQEVATRIKAAGGTCTPSKLQNQLQRAYEHVGSRVRGTTALVKACRDGVLARKVPGDCHQGDWGRSPKASHLQPAISVVLSKFGL